MSRLVNGISNPSSLIYKKGSRLLSGGPFTRLRGKNEDVHHLFDASKERDLFVPNRTSHDWLHNSRLVGTTLGCGLYRDENMHFSFKISDYLNPLLASPNPTVIPFSVYPCHTFQTDNLCNVAMSSNPLDFDEDWVIGIKFVGRQLNLCKPNSVRGTTWLAILAPSHSFHNSHLMYSKRDKMFYLPAPGSNYLCSWDHNFKDSNPGFLKYTYANRPKLSQSEYELLDSCSKSEQWVESASGERFLVKCYSLVTLSPKEKDSVFVHVYREEETAQGGRYMCYTDDIGDLCIFLSRGDQFCVEASSCPGLKPNSIYTIEHFFGVYHLTTRNFRHFEAPLEGPANPDEVDNLPYWLPPVSV